MEIGLVSETIFKMLKLNPNATQVYFRYNGKNTSMNIETFLNIYGNRTCGLNGEIYSKDNELNLNNYIKFID